MADSVAYVAHARIVNHKPTLRSMDLPGLGDSVRVGFHRQLAQVYKLDEAAYEEAPGTYDYLAGTVGACLTGVLSAMLEGRGVATGDGRLTTEVEGESEWEERVLRVKRIHCLYTLRTAPGVDQDLVRRVHDLHVARCSMAQSIKGAIEVTTDINLVAE